MNFLDSDENTTNTTTHCVNFSRDFSTKTGDSTVTIMCNGSFSWVVHGPLIAVCVLIIAFNSVVIALMRWKESLRTPTNSILASLAVSDLMSGLLGIPMIFACSLTKTPSETPVICVFSVLFMRFTAVSTVLHYVLVACDRFITINFSILHQVLVRWPCVRRTLIAIWLISATVTAVQLTWYNAENLREKKEEDKVYFLVLIVGFFAVPLAFMFCVYGRIIFVSIHHLRAFRARRENLGETVNSRSIRRDMRGTFILISMLAVFTGCWFPFFLMVIQSFIPVQIISTSSWGLCFVLFVRFVPPITNPLFNVLCKRDFRNSFRASVKSSGFRFAAPFINSKRRDVSIQTSLCLADTGRNTAESSRSPFLGTIEFQSSV